MKLRRKCAVTLLVLCMPVVIQAGCAPRNTKLARREAARGRLEKIRDRGPMKQKEAWYINPHPDETEIPYDVYFTWMYGDSPAAAKSSGPIRWIWQGKEVARGPRGWWEIRKRLAALPLESWVMVYPRNWMDVEDRMGGGRWGGEWPPFSFPSLWEVASERKLTVVFSVRDHKGRLHPAYEKHYRKWKQRQTEQEGRSAPATLNAGSG